MSAHAAPRTGTPSGWLGDAMAVLVSRRLLREHRPADGRRCCPKCSGWFGLARVRWPCRVWRESYEQLIARSQNKRAVDGPSRRR